MLFYPLSLHHYFLPFHLFPSHSYHHIVLKLGWKRDLLRECVEPNPGPSWEEVRSLLETKLGKRALTFKGQLDQFETALYDVYPRERTINSNENTP